LSRICDRFAELARASEKALVTYLTAGDPDLDTSEALLLETAGAGADVLEIGVPFSDPLADGPSIQAASQRALEAGVRLPDVFNLVRRLRTRVEKPIVLMTYFNPVQKYGLERFAKDAALAGVDGVIATDLPPEEAGDWKPVADAAGLSTIFLLAPTSTPERIEMISKMSTGFIYCVSRTGVTGARDEVPKEIGDIVASIRAKTDKPIVVGFGVSKREQVALITQRADGVVVGSALVDMVARNGAREELLAAVRRFVADLKGVER